MPGGRHLSKYEAVAQSLRDALRAGSFPPGSALPAQRVLSGMYGVSLMTLRQALQRLEREGLVISEPGRGTYVAHAAMSHQLTSLHSLTDELQAQGIDLRTTVLSQRSRRLPADTARELGRPVGEYALRLERLRSVGQLPLIQQVSWIPEPWRRDLAGVDFTTTSLYSALVENCSATIAHAEESIRAGLIDPALADRLGLNEGRPVLLMDRLTFDHRDQAIVFDRAQILNEQVLLSTQRRPNAVDVDWNYLDSSRRPPG